MTRVLDWPHPGAVGLLPVWESRGRGHMRVNRPVVVLQVFQRSAVIALGGERMQIRIEQLLRPGVSHR